MTTIKSTKIDGIAKWEDLDFNANNNTYESGETIVVRPLAKSDTETDWNPIMGEEATIMLERKSDGKILKEVQTHRPAQYSRLLWGTAWFDLPVFNEDTPCYIYVKKNTAYDTHNEIYVQHLQSPKKEILVRKKIATKRIDDDCNYVETTSESSDKQWFKVAFSKDGFANFHISPKDSNLDLDLYIYEYENEDSACLGSSTNGTGEDDTVFEVPVRAGKDYYLCVKNYNHGSGEYLIRAKNYPDGMGGVDEDILTKSWAEELSEQPLAKAFGVELPGSFVDLGTHSTSIKFGPFGATFRVGVLNIDNSIAELGSINFNNGLFESIRLNTGTNVSLKYNVENIPGLGEKIYTYLGKMGYGELSFGAGHIDIDATGIHVVGLEVQDTHKYILPPHIDATRQTFERISLTFDITWDQIKMVAAGVALVIGIIILLALTGASGGSVSPAALPAIAAAAGQLENQLAF